MTHVQVSKVVSTRAEICICIVDWTLYWLIRPLEVLLQQDVQFACVRSFVQSQIREFWITALTVICDGCCSADLGTNRDEPSKPWLISITIFFPPQVLHLHFAAWQLSLFIAWYKYFIHPVEAVRFFHISQMTTDFYRKVTSSTQIQICGF